MNVTPWVMGFWGSFLSLTLISAGLAMADGSLQNVWSLAKSPSSGPAEAIGTYSAGCLAGGQELPQSGVGYQTQHPERNRSYGHPDTVQFVRNLASTLHEHGYSLSVGDLGQARGGPLPTGHASHQMGLDVDLSFRNPSLSVLGKNRKVDPTLFTDEQLLQLKMSALDPRVQRIFVNPAIKVFLCSSLNQTDLHWVQKLRPWNGHDEHFHVRLHCPVGALYCKPQFAVDYPVEDTAGCEEARQHHRTETDAEIDARATDRPNPLPPLPAECTKVLKAISSQAQDVH